MKKIERALAVLVFVHFICFHYTCTEAFPAITSPAAATGARMFIPSTEAASIDSFLLHWMREWRIPGAALAIVDSDRIAYERGFGISNSPDDLITPETPFILGSTTKSFTALTIMQLVDKGIIDLDASVQEYLPWFTVKSHEKSGQITIRHLLTHTSGICERDGLLGIANPDTSGSALDRYVHRLQSTKISREVGSRWEYSNANYAILGRVIQEVSDMTYEAFVRENILKPLGMTNSFTSQAEAQRNGLAKGHQLWFGYPISANTVPYARCLAPAGYLISSAEDLGHYLMAHLNNGRYKGARIISENGLELLHEPAAGISDGMQYAMGWIEQNHDGERVVWHNGGLPHYYSFIAILPQRGVGIALLLNAMHIFSADEFDALGFGIIDLVVGNRPAVLGNPLNARIERATYGAAFVLLGLQFLWIMISILFRRRRFMRTKRSAIAGRAALVWWIISPIILGLSIAILMLYALPLASGSPLAVVLLYAPDVMSVFLLNAVMGLSWGFTEAALKIKKLRMDRPSLVQIGSHM